VFRDRTTWLPVTGRRLWYTTHSDIGQSSAIVRDPENNSARSAGVNFIFEDSSSVDSASSRIDRHGSWPATSEDWYGTWSYRRSGNASTPASSGRHSSVHLFESTSVHQSANTSVSVLAQASSVARSRLPRRGCCSCGCCDCYSLLWFVGAAAFVAITVCGRRTDNGSSNSNEMAFYYAKKIQWFFQDLWSRLVSGDLFVTNTRLRRAGNWVVKIICFCLFVCLFVCLFIVNTAVTYGEHSFLKAIRRISIRFMPVFSSLCFLLRFTSANAPNHGLLFILFSYKTL